MTMEHHQFKKNLANAMVLFKVNTIHFCQYKNQNFQPLLKFNASLPENYN